MRTLSQMEEGPAQDCRPLPQRPSSEDLNPPDLTCSWSCSWQFSF